MRGHRENVDAFRKERRPLGDLGCRRRARARHVERWVGDRGLVAGLTGAEKAELSAARKRIADLEAELAVSRRAVELLKEEIFPKGGSRRRK